jgi:hypothetical protein
VNWLLRLAFISLFSAALPVHGRSNLVSFISTNFEYIGQGRTYVTTNEAEFTVYASAQHIEVYAFGFSVRFDPPEASNFVVGKYTNATSFLLDQSLPRLWIFGNGRSCNEATGNAFEILEFHTDTNAQVDRLWIKFQYRCYGTFSAPMLGEIRFHSETAPGPQPRTLFVPEQYPTIQGAIDDANSLDDVVLVSPGTYAEAVTFKGKRIAVKSTHGAAATRVIAPEGGYAFRFENDENAMAELTGFTLQDCGGGIYCNHTLPRITGNVISNVQYGVNCYFGGPTILSNTIANCSVQGIRLVGGAMQCERNIVENSYWGIFADASSEGSAQPAFRNNIIRWNYRQGIELSSKTDAEVTQNVIYENRGYGLAWTVMSGWRGPIVRHNTIVNNGRGGVYANGIDSQVEFENNIVVGAVAFECGIGYDANAPIIRFNNVYSASGTPYVGGAITNMTGFNGNISALPWFLDPAFGDYRLRAGSPDIDAASNDFAVALDFENVPRPVDGDGVPLALPDMGAYEFVAGPPRPPTSLAALATDASIFLSWRTFDEATSYVLLRGTNAAGPFAQVAHLVTTNFMDSEVLPNLVYFYAIAGSNGVGLGIFSPPVSVKAGNHPPITTNYLITIDEDTAGVLDFSMNSFDPDQDPLFFEIGATPADGAVTLSTNIATFSPREDFAGTNSFTFLIHDGRGGTATGLVTVVVKAVDDAPTAFSIDVAVPANSASNQFVLSGADVESTELTYRVTSGPFGGFIRVNTNTGAFEYTPAHATVGYDYFTFVTFDAEKESLEAMVTILVEPPFDQDDDGMDDEWENFWDVNNPSADSDHDGVTNLQEYFANTSPRDAGSVVRIDSLCRDNAGQFVLKWQSVGGTRYRVLSADQLGVDAAFAEIPRAASDEIDHAPSGILSTQTFVDSRSAPESGTRIYLIKVIQ